MSTTSQAAQARVDAPPRSTPELDDAFDLELEAMALATTEPPPEEPREPGLRRYLTYQVKDFVRHRAAVMLPLALLALWIFHHNYDPTWIERLHAHGRMLRLTEPGYFRGVVMSGAMMMGALGSLFSAAGIVSRDREGGHQKFLFAKPVRITRFYLQSFAVNGVGLLLVSALVLLCAALAFVRPVPIVEPLLAVGTLYVAVGGLTFLLSTLVRFDIAAAAVLALLAVPLRQAAEQGRWWAVLTSWILPPLQLLDAFDGGPNRPTMLRMVSSLVAYGAAYVAAGVAVLRKRSIMR